jgi:hypothetical protein
LEDRRGVSIEQVARRAGVDEDYVHHLEELGALRGGAHGYEDRDVHVVALLSMWEGAGLSPASILEAVDGGQLSLDFLDSPAWELPEPLPITYRAFAESHGVPLDLLRGIQEAMGFAAPDPDDRVARDDAELAELARRAGLCEATVRSHQGGQLLTAETYSGAAT